MKFDRKVIIGLTLALLVFIGIGTYSYRNMQELIRSSNTLVGNHEVLEKFFLILKDTAEAKGNQRDFIITGQTACLTSCQDALFDVDQKVREIRNSIPHANDARSAQFEKLNDLLVGEIDFMKKSVDARNHSGFAAAVKMIRNSAGQETMDDIVKLVWTMQEEEKVLLKSQTAQMKEDANNAQQTFVVGLVADAALLLLVYAFVRGEMQKRNRTERRLNETTSVFQAVMEKMDDAVLVVDSQGRLLVANPACQKLMGVDPSRPDGWEPIFRSNRTFHADKATVLKFEEQPLYGALYQGQSGSMDLFRKDGRSSEGKFFHCMATPLKDAAGRVTQAVAVWTDITDRMAQQSLIREDNARLKQSVVRLEQHNHEISLFTRLVESLQACLTVEEVARTSVSVMQELFPQTSGGVFIINNSHNRVDLAAGFGDRKLLPEQFHPEECWAIRRGQLHTVGVHQHNLACAHFDRQHKPVEGLCVPLTAQGTAVGLIYIGSAVEDRVLKNQEWAVLLGEQVALAIANLQLKETMKNQSIRDPLTNLFNRRYLEEALDREMARAERSGSNLSVLMMDIDHFKQFNDKFGHDAGDHVLSEVGSFLNRFVRKSDISCRYGGEELIVLLPDTAPDDARQIAEQVRQGVHELALSHLNISLGTVTVSVGVASFPSDSRTGAEMLREADIALYNAKSLGRNRVVSWADVSAEGKKGFSRLTTELNSNPLKVRFQV